MGTPTNNHPANIPAKAEVALSPAIAPATPKAPVTIPILLNADRNGLGYGSESTSHGINSSVR